MTRRELWEMIDRGEVRGRWGGVGEDVNSILNTFSARLTTQLQRPLQRTPQTSDNPSNTSKPTTVSDHFLTNDHSANDITLIPLELIKSNRDSVRKAREAYLIERGETLEPLGMNKKDEM